MPHPNAHPKTCCKCCKMPKSNFLFLGTTFVVVGYSEMLHPNPKSVTKSLNLTFLFLGVTCFVGGMLKIPHPNLKIQIFKCLYEIEISYSFPGIK